MSVKGWKFYIIARRIELPGYGEDAYHHWNRVLLPAVKVLLGACVRCIVGCTLRLVSHYRASCLPAHEVATRILRASDGKFRIRTFSRIDSDTAFTFLGKSIARLRRSCSSTYRVQWTILENTITVLETPRSFLSPLSILFTRGTFATITAMRRRTKLVARNDQESVFWEITANDTCTPWTIIISP